MARRYPNCWLMTDERMAAGLWPALKRLPPGAGVVFRHHATPPAQRRALLRRVERIATARRLVLLVAGGGSGKAGVHGVTGARRVRSAAAHDRREAVRGVQAGAALLFVSPVFATRSHPDAAPLGPMRAGRIGKRLHVGVIAMGGMDARRWRRIARLGFDGWAAIDAWLPSR
ncbi:thiamine phosphate synthase [Sphingomonas bacterium]|uniref:thiamine phosphate synthase n=1 Tax=Sphingomonas bacterium TaxID=1895847 RepID=UPI0020C61E9A|nr:thiamine phosphate synthase [Sphingomonas bacterium]